MKALSKIVATVVAIYTLLTAGFLLGMAFNRAVRVSNPFAPRKRADRQPTPAAATPKSSSSLSSGPSRPTFGASPSGSSFGKGGVSR